MTDTKACCVPGCEEQIPVYFFMCSPHWYEIPSRLRYSISNARKEGKTIDQEDIDSAINALNVGYKYKPVNQPKPNTGNKIHMSDQIHNVLPVILMALAVSVLQYHAIKWWTELITGTWPGWTMALLLAPWGGWGMSGAFEVWNIWSWAHSWRWNWWLNSALITSVLLVAGPVYKLAEPLVQGLVGVAVVQDTERVKAARESVRSAMEKVHSYQADWTLRTRERARLQQLEEQEREARSHLDFLLSKQEQKMEEEGLEIWQWGKVVVIASGLILLQVAAAICAYSLFGEDGKSIYGKREDKR